MSYNSKFTGPEVESILDKSKDLNEKVQSIYIEKNAESINIDDIKSALTIDELNGVGDNDKTIVVRCLDGQGLLTKSTGSFFNLNIIVRKNITSHAELISVIFSVSNNNILLFNNIKYGLRVVITDNLSSTSTTAALSANQGRVLSEKIDKKVINITDPDDGLCQSILSDFSHAIPGIFGHDIDTLFANLAGGAVYVYNGVPLSISRSDGEGTMSIFFTYKGNMYFHDYFYSAGRGGLTTKPIANVLV